MILSIPRFALVCCCCCTHEALAEELGQPLESFSHGHDETGTITNRYNKTSKKKFYKKRDKNQDYELLEDYSILYLLSSLGSLFDTRTDRIVLWVTLAYAREYMIQHFAYAPVSKRDQRELSRYLDEINFREICNPY